MPPIRKAIGRAGWSRSRCDSAPVCGGSSRACRPGRRACPS